MCYVMLCVIVQLFNPRTSLLYRLWEISPAPVAIFNKLCEILDCLDV